MVVEDEGYRTAVVCTAQILGEESGSIHTQDRHKWSLWKLCKAANIELPSV